MVLQFPSFLYLDFFSKQLLLLSTSTLNSRSRQVKISLSNAKLNTAIYFKKRREEVMVSKDHVEQASFWNETDVN